MLHIHPTHEDTHESNLYIRNPLPWLLSQNHLLKHKRCKMAHSVHSFWGAGNLSGGGRGGEVALEVWGEALGGGGGAVKGLWAHCSHCGSPPAPHHPYEKDLQDSHSSEAQ